jgi:hypothetical protein
MRLLILLLIPFCSFAQQSGDHKIIVSADSSNLYQKVKRALVENNFVVKDDGSANVLTTYPKEISSIPGSMFIRAEIEGGKVVLSGGYGLLKQDGFNYTRSASSFKPVVYFKGSKGWKTLLSVAGAIGGPLSYSK